MKRSFLLLALGLLGLTFSSTASAQRVAVSVPASARCGTVYSSPGYCVGPVSAGAIYRPSPVCYPVAPVVYYPTPCYSGFTTGTTVVYSSGYSTNVNPVVRVDNIGAPVVFSGNILANPNGGEPRKLQLRTSR